MQEKCTLPVLDLLVFAFAINSYLGNSAWHLSLAALQRYMHAAVTFLLSPYHPVTQQVNAAAFSYLTPTVYSV